MKQNVRSNERIPRIAMAVAVGIGAAFAPTWLKATLYAMAGGLLVSVATGYCPVNAALERGEPERTWQMLKTYRVEA